MGVTRTLRGFSATAVRCARPGAARGGWSGGLPLPVLCVGDHPDLAGLGAELRGQVHRKADAGPGQHVPAGGLEFRLGLAAGVADSNFSRMHVQKTVE